MRQEWTLYTAMDLSVHLQPRGRATHGLTGCNHAWRSSMFCTQCGQTLPEGGQFCPACGHAIHSSAAITDPTARHAGNAGVAAKTYLAQSIIVTILCCWPFGIPAIVYSTKVISANSAGNYAQAHEDSKRALMWSWISFGVGLLVLIAYGALIAIDSTI